MHKINFMDLSQETLVSLLKVYSKNSLTVDGLWFLNVEEKFGMDTAIEIDKMIWGRYGVTEALRLKKILKLPDNGGIPALVKALNFQIWVPGMEYDFSEITDEKAIFNITDCSVQRARIKACRPEFHCKPVGQVLFESFARTIDEKIDMRCLMCPPDDHPDDVWCSWEFTYKGKTNGKYEKIGKIDYSDIPKATLVELIKIYSKNVITIDGLWFINLEERYGIDLAIDLDTKVWERYGITEVRRLKKLLNITDGGIENLIKALNFQIWVPDMDFEFQDISDKKVVFNITDCTPQKLRLRDNRGEFECKPVGVALFNKFAEEIDPKIKMRCKFCPPDKHPDDIWCIWEFSLED